MVKSIPPVHQDFISPVELEEVLPGHPRYRIQQGRIEMARLEGRGEHRTVVYVPLCNFACRIRREVRYTDGVQDELLFELEAPPQPAPFRPPGCARASLLRCTGRCGSGGPGPS